MASQSASQPTTVAAAFGARLGQGRWPYAGADQLPLLLASLAIAVGSFLPWVVVGDAQMSGVQGGGVWTFYLANFGIAGAMVRRHRRLAAASGAVAGAGALGIGGWQLLHLAGQVGFEGWHPGLGLLAVILGGVIALRSAWRLGHALPDPRLVPDDAGRGG